MEKKYHVLLANVQVFSIIILHHNKKTPNWNTRRRKKKLNKEENS